MARNLRKAAARPARRRGVPGWLMLVIGLGLGIGLTWGANRYLQSSDRPLSGLRTLLASKPEPAEKPPAKPAAPAASAPKPKLDFYTILPEIETVLPEKAAKPAKPVAKPESETGVNYLLQAGSFSNPADADQLRAKLALSGLEARIEKVAIEGKGEFHRVRLGPYGSVQELDNADGRLAKLGIKAVRLKLKKAGA
ncbi:MAG: SPOR domain-containing protein [Gammaproteobacteria bacterium]|nr:SPOR domain-containing protein [Gammaproteobacteria bacterium]